MCNSANVLHTLFPSIELKWLTCFLIQWSKTFMIKWRDFSKSRNPYTPYCFSIVTSLLIKHMPTIRLRRAARRRARLNRFETQALSQDKDNLFEARPTNYWYYLFVAVFALLLFNVAFSISHTNIEIATDVFIFFWFTITILAKTGKKTLQRCKSNLTIAIESKGEKKQIKKGSQYCHCFYGKSDKVW